MSLGKDQPDLVVDFPVVRALANRALALDPEWNNGGIHEFFITLESQPEALGGSPNAPANILPRRSVFKRVSCPGRSWNSPRASRSATRTARSSKS